MLPLLCDRTVDDLHELHDDTLLNTYEAALYLGLRPNTLVVYRCVRPDKGPPFRRIAGKNIRYRLGDVREYARGGQEMSTGVRTSSNANLAARGFSRKGGE